jgi:hypothetical protein
MWKFYFKQKVETATLPSVARNDIALLDASKFFQVAREDVAGHRDCAGTK